ncbi:Uncharacterised protein [Campylobacter hyointestinalis subsp. hyointestinalis]|uniref:DUF4376 domain-containing protein n=1 Tax=Campylobacter hyointestinalis TaxID=198 RepID=UPI00072640D4|nr:DUF4376 domain-containing protein [Campylobacter hyointestinalis]CUU87834.1 Uncharacterised protein [Campylobacter hyointestinalis subsp. hyointestinalis]
MKLYDIKEKQIVELEYISNSEGTFYISGLSSSKLKSYGYKKVVEDDYPKNDDPYKEVVSSGAIKADVYHISYSIVDKPAGVVAAIKYEEWKKDREAKVANIEVSLDNCKGLDGSTNNGVIFQGDETSQNRLGRAISASSIAGVGSTLWTAKNNKVYELSVAQLGEMLLKAGQAQTAIWNENRPTKGDI